MRDLVRHEIQKGCMRQKRTEMWDMDAKQEMENNRNVTDGNNEGFKEL